MPKINEWVIPKIDKPVETVYEIKSEDYKVPSFEEFMKDYQADEKVNYDDLSGGSVGEVKGYGPCYKGCGYANPGCEHYLDEKYVPLYLTCPAPPYDENGNAFCTNKVASAWTHSNCGGGRAYINTDLNIKCMKPGCGSVVHITRARFACSSHESTYARASKSEFGNALTILNGLWKGKGPLIKEYVEMMTKKALREDGFYN